MARLAPFNRIRTNLSLKLNNPEPMPTDLSQ